MTFKEILIENDLKKPFCDWLSFTVDYTKESFHWINETFGESEKQANGKGGYSHFCYFVNGGELYYSPERQTNKIFVNLSAKALASQNKEISEIISQAIGYGGKFTRLDIAMDDYDGFLDLDYIYEKLSGREVNTKMDSVRRLDSFSLKDGNVKGDTIYVGSPKSEIMVRIYDKAGQTGIDSHWIRLEFQMRGTVADQYCNPDPKLHSGEIKSYLDRDFCKTAFYYLRFIDRKYNAKNKPVNKRHWNSSEFWTTFLRTGEGEKIGRPRYTLGLEDVRKWVGNQVSGALALIADTYGKEEIDKLTKNGKAKMEKNSNYRKLAKEYHLTKEKNSEIISLYANQKL